MNPSPAFSLPTVHIAVTSAVVRAGLLALLTDAGFEISQDGAVWVIDDTLLTDPDPLADAPAVVALGSAAWASLLPDIVSGGYAALPADATPAELIAGILGASAGLAVLPPSQVQAMLDEEEDDFTLPESDVSLTPRERDVLALLTEGLSNKRVARELGVSESTVKFHAQAIYSKLGVQSRAAAVSRGIQLGLVSV